jgi:hypothetical protein
LQRYKERNKASNNSGAIGIVGGLGVVGADAGMCTIKGTMQATGIIFGIAAIGGGGGLAWHFSSYGNIR